MIKSPPRITSIEQFLSVVDDFGDADDTLYRGQREDWALIPKIARVKAREGKFLPEITMLGELRRQIGQYVAQQPSSDWDLLAMAQHHGMMTRLLDWSLNPLTALWFAIELPASSPDRDGVVWCLEPESNDYVTYFEKESPFEDGPTRVFMPNQVSARIRAQRGFFTVHRPTKQGQFVPLERNSRMKRRMKKIVVAASAFPDLRFYLDRFGINRASQFPDVDGLCQHISWCHCLVSDEEEKPRKASRRK